MLNCVYFLTVIIHDRTTTPQKATRSCSCVIFHFIYVFDIIWATTQLNQAKTWKKWKKTYRKCKQRSIHAHNRSCNNATIYESGNKWSYDLLQCVKHTLWHKDCWNFALTKNKHNDKTEAKLLLSIPARQKKKQHLCVACSHLIEEKNRFIEIFIGSNRLAN